MLGCGGCMESLRRTRAGCYTLEHAHSIEALMEMTPEARNALLLPADSLFPDRPALYLTEKQTRRVLCGGEFSHAAPEGEYRFYGPDGAFLALGRVEDGVARTVKSFFEVN